MFNLVNVLFFIRNLVYKKASITDPENLTFAFTICNVKNVLYIIAILLQLGVKGNLK